jgi:hypothetical protein
MSLAKVTIAITSLLRWGYLKACLDSIRQNLPECKVLVADDSDTDLCANVVGPSCIRLPFDSGLTRKRNKIVEAAETPYFFCGADDFDFSTPGFRLGLESAAALLDTNPEIDLVGGRVDNNPYESNLEYDANSNVIRERRLVPDGCRFQKCDLVVNAFLARISTIREVPWDNDVVPIGGEHGLLFWQMKKAGKTTVWLPGLNINTLHLGAGPDVQDPRYGQFRRRAFAAGHAIMLKKLGIKDWVGA